LRRFDSLCSNRQMEPDDRKEAEPILHTLRAESPAEPALDAGFSEAELKEMSASLDLEVISLLNLC